MRIMSFCISASRLFADRVKFDSYTLASVRTPDQVELLVLLENSDSRNFDFQIV